jgi:hypothetical protein
MCCPIDPRVWLLGSVRVVARILSRISNGLASGGAQQTEPPTAASNLQRCFGLKRVNVFVGHKTLRQSLLFLAVEVARRLLKVLVLEL